MTSFQLLRSSLRCGARPHCILLSVGAYNRTLNGSLRCTRSPKVKRFLGEFFSEEELDFTEDSLKAKIDSQYYVDRTVPDEQYNKMLKKAPEFLVKCKSILIKLNEKKIHEIRKEFQRALNEKR